MKNKIIILFALFSLSLTAQDNVIDEVVWIVGEEAILKSEVEEERLRAQYEGTPIPGDPYCVIPEQLAIQKLFLHQAELDSIEVNESSVSSQVDMRMNYYVSQIGSKEKMEEYFRKTSSEIREEMMTMVRNQMIIQQMQAKLTENISPTPAEVRRFYNSLHQDSIPMATFQLKHLMILQHLRVLLNQNSHTLIWMLVFQKKIRLSFITIN
jgi:peptidyl-prolyl cis-trans isomerase SurA